jgi:hypothetical protein
MAPETQKKWFENVRTLLLQRLSHKAETLKIPENNELFTKIKRRIPDYCELYLQKVGIDKNLSIKDFVRKTKSDICSLEHVAVWDKLVGF